MATLSVAAILAENARRRPDKEALVEGDLRLTFAEVWQRARARAGALTGLGVRPGDRIALMAPNTADFPQAYYAIAATGGVVVPVHLLLSAAEVEHVLRDSGATLLLCHPAQAETGAAAAREAGVRVITLGDELDKLAADAEPLPSYVTRDADDPAVVFYTSGTTGVPKGAVLSHFNLVMNATVNAFDANDIRPDDIALGALPLFHAFGQTVSLNSTWRAGATLVLLPRFDAARAIELMVREKVNTFHGVPTMFVALAAAAADAGALPDLRVCISGGASLPVAVLERFEEAFGAKIYEGYGLSETSPAAAVNQPVFGARPGTIGHPCGAWTWRSPARRSRGASSCCRPASWARSSCAVTTSSPATSAAPRPPPRRSSTAGSAPGTSAPRTTRGSSGSSTGRRTSSSGAATTSIRGRSRRS